MPLFAVFSIIIYNKSTKGILSRKGFIPKDGSQFEMELSGLLIHVTEIQGHRIENTVVKRLPEEAKETAPEI